MPPTTIRDFLSHTVHRWPNLGLIVNIIPSLDIPSRKVVLLLCQTACSPSDKATWDLALHALSEARIIRDGNYSHLTVDEIYDFCDIISNSLLVRSFISMLVRCEAYEDSQCGYEKVLAERVQKEISASQYKRAKNRLSYSSFFCRFNDAEPYSIYYPLTPAWHFYAERFAFSFVTRVQDSGILFPKVQRRKNMSRDTCDRLWDAGYRCVERTKYNFTTLDLELHKIQTGVEIGGICEMRSAWRYNDLQPRCYYCIGGTSYWRARYMKRIAVIMMECQVQTTAKRRADPSQISFELDDEDWVVIWDYSAFTTNLSELKFFLYWVSRYAEEYSHVGIKTLDYSDGVVFHMLHELLDAYNEGVNENALYTIFRVADVAIQGYCETEIPLVQNNSGMLGIPGNIGFSTAQHGFHVSPASKTHSSSCEIGDDATAVVNEDPDIRFHRHLETIGDVHRDKTDILPPLEYGERQLSKFIKRRLCRTSYGITIDELYSFPMLALVFGVKDDFHTVRREDRTSVTIKFCHQTGSLLWSIYQAKEIDEADASLLTDVLRNCYRRLRLPFNGRLPGFRHHTIDGMLPCCVPPLGYSYCNEDWAEVLWDRMIKTIMILPLELSADPPPYQYNGQKFIASVSKMVQVLIDVGSVKKLGVANEKLVASEENYWRFKRIFSSPERVYKLEYVGQPPDWYSDISSVDPLNSYLEVI